MPTRRKAFMLIDVVAALTVLGILVTVLAVALGRQQLASQRLADSRAAVRLAEQVLTDLQCGRPLPGSDPQAQVQVIPLTSGQPVPGHRWTQVQVTFHGRSATLTGLVPQGGNP